jgi:hypothetical protein
VHDAARLAERGVPNLVFVTAPFEDAARFAALAAGRPDLPRIILPHPVAGTGAGALRALAADVASSAAARLRGNPA